MTTVRTAVITGIGACLPRAGGEERGDRGTARGHHRLDPRANRHRAALRPGSRLGHVRFSPSARDGGRWTPPAWTASTFLIIATCTPRQTRSPATAPTVAGAAGPVRPSAPSTSTAPARASSTRLTVGAGLLASGLVHQRAGDRRRGDCRPSRTRTIGRPAPLFGDGAGAVVIRAGGSDEPGALSGVRARQRGRAGRPAVRPRPAGSRPNASQAPEYPPGDAYLSMQGPRGSTATP